MTTEKQNDHAEGAAATTSMEFLALAQRAELAEIERDAARRELACERAAKKLAVDRAKKAEAERDEWRLAAKAEAAERRRAHVERDEAYTLLRDVRRRRNIHDDLSWHLLSARIDAMLKEDRS